MLALPFPVKSPVPAICQLVGTTPDPGRQSHLRRLGSTTQCRHSCCATECCLRLSGEIASSSDLPARSDDAKVLPDKAARAIGIPKLRVAVGITPQNAFAGPFKTPSPLNSPVPATCQLVGTTPRSCPTKPPEPLAFHNSVSPSALRHKTPASLAPLKSPVPAICQSPPTIPRFWPAKLAEPEFEFQSSTSPFVFRQRMSALSSSLKKFGAVGVISNTSRR